MLPSSVIMLDAVADAAAAAAAACGVIPRLTLASSASAAHLIVVTKFLVDPKPANYLHLPQRVKMGGYLPRGTTTRFNFKRLEENSGFNRVHAAANPTGTMSQVS